MKEILWLLVFIIEKLNLFKHLTQYLNVDDILNIKNPYFDDMVRSCYPPVIQFKKNECV